MRVTIFAVVVFDRLPGCLCVNVGERMDAPDADLHLPLASLGNVG